MVDECDSMLSLVNMLRVLQVNQSLRKKARGRNVPMMRDITTTFGRVESSANPAILSCLPDAGWPASASFPSPALSSRMYEVARRARCLPSQDARSPDAHGNHKSEVHQSLTFGIFPLNVDSNGRI